MGSIKQRLIANQQRRADLRDFQTQSEQLERGKSFQQRAYELEALVLQKASRIKQLQLEDDRLQLERQALWASRDLLIESSRQQLEAEIAELAFKAHGFRNPAPPTGTAALSRQEERRDKQREQQQKIGDIRQEKTRAVAMIPADEPEQRFRVANLYDDAIDRELENLRKLL